MGVLQEKKFPMLSKVEGNSEEEVKKYFNGLSAEERIALQKEVDRLGKTIGKAIKQVGETLVSVIDTIPIEELLSAIKKLNEMRLDNKKS